MYDCRRRVLIFIFVSIPTQQEINVPATSSQLPLDVGAFRHLEVVVLLLLSTMTSDVHQRRSPITRALVHSMYNLLVDLFFPTVMT